MKASFEKVAKNEVLLTIEVGADKVADALDRAFKKVSKQVNVPGFRKGKVPRAMFEQKYGVESLYQDAIDIILPEVYVAALVETGVEPIDRPEIDVLQFEKGQEMKFTAKVQVKPEVELGKYKGLKVEKKDFKVLAADVDQELKAMQNRHAELIVVEKGAAKDGDSVVIDFEGFKDGVAFEGGKAERYTLELGSGSFIPGFEEQVVGMASGESKDITVTFPENYQSEDLQGKEVVFKIQLHDIKRKQLPKLDDEFAKDVSEFETLAEYKKDIKEKLQARKDQEKKVYVENAIVEQAAANATVEVPAVMVEDEIETMIKDFDNRLRMQGMNLEMYFQFSGQTEATVREQMKPDAEKRVLNQLVLEAIAKAEGIEVTDADVDAELEALATAYNRTVEDLRQLFSSNGNLAQLKSDISNKKTVELLVGNN
jgi:trigger factor